VILLEHDRGLPVGLVDELVARYAGAVLSESLTREVQCIIELAFDRIEVPAKVTASLGHTRFGSAIDVTIDAPLFSTEQIVMILGEPSITTPVQAVWSLQ